MIKRQVTIINKLGLHARSAAKFATTANHYESEIRAGITDKLVDGKSVMSLMLLAATQGSLLNLEIEGPDEQEAADALEGLIADRFGEDQ